MVCILEFPPLDKRQKIVVEKRLLSPGETENNNQTIPKHGAPTTGHLVRLCEFLRYSSTQALETTDSAFHLAMNCEFRGYAIKRHFGLKYMIPVNHFFPGRAKGSMRANRGMSRRQLGALLVLNQCPWRSDWTSA